MSNYVTDCLASCERDGENKCKTLVIDFASENGFPFQNIQTVLPTLIKTQSII